MDNIILTRNPAWVNVFIRTASNSLVTLLSGDDHETTVPMTTLLAVSPLIRAMLVDTGLHPSVIGQIVLSFPGMDSAALSHAGDILCKGVANVKGRDMIDEVKMVFKMLGVAATPSFVVGDGNIASFDSEVIDVKQEEDEIPNDNEETRPSRGESFSPVLQVIEGVKVKEFKEIGVKRKRDERMTRNPRGRAKTIKVGKHIRRRCGDCEGCRRPNCGRCRNCWDMKCFGGKGTRAQACEGRKCLKMGGSGMIPMPCTRLRCKLCGQEFDDLKCLASHRRECNSSKEVKEM